MNQPGLFVLCTIYLIGIYICIKQVVFALNTLREFYGDDTDIIKPRNIPHEVFLWVGAFSIAALTFGIMIALTILKALR